MNSGYSDLNDLLLLKCPRETFINPLSLTFLMILEVINFRGDSKSLGDRARWLQEMTQQWKLQKKNLRKQ